VIVDFLQKILFLFFVRDSNKKYFFNYIVMYNNNQKLIDLFNFEISKKIKFCDNYISRKATEEEYFIAYLNFTSNCSYYSRFKFYNERTKSYITGKTLNNKFNKWVSSGVFENIFKNTSNIYCESRNRSNFKHLSEDTLFVPNRLCSKHDIGRCVYYKSKNGIKIDAIVDTEGVPIDISTSPGNENDATIAIKRIPIIANKINAEKYKDSNKYKTIILGDAIYDNKNLKEIIKDNNMSSITAPNKRNTKNPEKIKNKELSSKHKQKLKKRHIVENCFSWLTQYSPRFYRVFTRKAFNFLNEIYIYATKIILAKF